VDKENYTAQKKKTDDSVYFGFCCGSQKQFEEAILSRETILPAHFKNT